MYKMTLPIGDWSGDGHEKNENILVFSNRPVEDVREANHLIETEIGIKVSDLCGEYEETALSADTRNKLAGLGIETNDDYAYDPDGMADLWITLLMKAMTGLELHRPDDAEAIPALEYYGFDDKRRCFSSPGYGIFN